MKNLNYLSRFVILFLMLALPVSSQTEKNSLPSGVTEDLLNSLTDENGKRIIPDDPEGDAMQAPKVFNGQGTSNFFGVSVSNAGDINGDGYGDIIVGAFLYNTGAGRAYIYYGGLYMNTIADVILTGPSSNIYFGYSVASAGDVNGDGYSDVIVGAYGYSSDRGRAYVFFGGTNMNNTADVIMTGEVNGDAFGYSVSSAGDVNGDGYSDVIAGAFYANGHGKGYIYLGGANMNNVADIILTGQLFEALGYSVSSAGDVNGDGYSDVITGAPSYDNARGRVHVFFGGANMNNVADVTINGEATNDEFGYSVSTAGDVNGDGYSDVIAGSLNLNSNTGKAYVYYGGASMNNTADVIMSNTASNIFYASSVASAGDINGDGYSDVIVGAYGHNSNRGMANVFFGGTNMNNISDITLTGETSGSQFGYSVSAAGDVNGDGYADIIVGAQGYNSNTGRAYLFDYYMSGEIIPDITATGEASGNNYGNSVSTAGDVNGDGYDDIIVGAPYNNSSRGKAYIFLGGENMDNVADVTMSGTAPGNYLGSSVSTAGDVNNDGYDDVIVGVSNLNRALIFYGAPSMDNNADVTLTGSGGAFGYSVSDAGDVNGDGYSDVVVGEPTINSFSGRISIFYGGAIPDNTADVVINGESAGNQFGNTVSAGDVNGDGYSDVISASSSHNNATGKAYIYFGGTNMDTVSDVSMSGEAINNYFGTSVSTAGDVNKDGYSDLIVGAPGSSGKSYIYYGGANMNNIADVTFTGNSFEEFGNSVSNAGDVNGDGYSDVIAGARSNNSTTGKVYIFFGGLNMNNTADVTMTGEAASNYFGYSVSGAGDVNGDGYSDLVVGAPNHNSATGKSYTFLSSKINVKPNILSAKDVPNDQGGYVNLRFAKSSFDILSSYTNGITYKLERSLPPGINGYQWISVGSIPGTFEPFYTAEVHTPQDSGSSGNNTFFFRVTAVSNSTTEFWRSNIVSGYSRDNLAPLPPANLMASLITNYTQLTWNQNTENDLRQYIIYRNGIQLGTSTALNYNDNTIIPDSSYTYRIAAEDIHGNISSQSNSVNINYTVATVNIKVIPEGFYNASLNVIQMKDTVRAYLHNNSSPYNIVDSSIAVIDSVTFQGSFKFIHAVNGTYYIIVKHRNSIETWSSSGISVTHGSPVNYDFTNSSLQAYGSNMIQIDSSPARFAIYSGDVNQDGVVDATDAGAIDNDAFNFTIGYVSTDITGDDLVDATDAALADNNAFNFVGKVVP